MPKVDKIVLKRPLSSYQPRLSRFLALLRQVRGLKPANLHLWQVMDGSAFQDTETALEVALHNACSKKTSGAANE